MSQQSWEGFGNWWGDTWGQIGGSIQDGVSRVLDYWVDDYTGATPMVQQNPEPEYQQQPVDPRVYDDSGALNLTNPWVLGGAALVVIGVGAVIYRVVR